MHETVEAYLEANTEHNDLLVKLRKLLNSTELVEGVKWGIPVYTISHKNVVGLAAFKSYVGIWFYNGVFLADKKEKLINAQEGKTQGLRQWRFASEAEFDEKLVLKYVEEAIQNQKDGKELRPQKKPLIIPDELKEELASDPQIADAFENLSLTSKRDYAEYIATAKKEETKLRRLDKILPMIRDGIGLNDRYS
ncbi:MAG: YdeI/OmpD-associated family protein [Cyclobacteriaceae bacterium]